MPIPPVLPSLRPLYEQSGWIFHTGTRSVAQYFHHPTSRVVTDLDLRRKDVLDGLNRYSGVTNNQVVVPVGWELWVRGTMSEDVVDILKSFEHIWVHHEARSVSDTVVSSELDMRACGRESDISSEISSFYVGVVGRRLTHFPQQLLLLMRKRTGLT